MKRQYDNRGLQPAPAESLEEAYAPRGLQAQLRQTSGYEQQRAMVSPASNAPVQRKEVQGSGLGEFFDSHESGAEQDAMFSFDANTEGAQELSGAPDHAMPNASWSEQQDSSNGWVEQGITQEGAQSPAGGEGAGKTEEWTQNSMQETAGEIAGGAATGATEQSDLGSMVGTGGMASPELGEATREKLEEWGLLNNPELGSMLGTGGLANPAALGGHSDLSNAAAVLGRSRNGRSVGYDGKSVSVARSWDLTSALPKPPPIRFVVMGVPCFLSFAPVASVSVKGGVAAEEKRGEGESLKASGSIKAGAKMQLGAGMPEFASAGGQADLTTALSCGVTAFRNGDIEVDGGSLKTSGTASLFVSCKMLKDDGEPDSDTWTLKLAEAELFQIKYQSYHSQTGFTGLQYLPGKDVVKIERWMASRLKAVDEFLEKHLESESNAIAHGIGVVVPGDNPMKATERENAKSAQMGSYTQWYRFHKARHWRPSWIPYMTTAEQDQIFWAYWRWWEAKAKVPDTIFYNRSAAVAHAHAMKNSAGSQESVILNRAQKASIHNSPGENVDPNSPLTHPDHDKDPHNDTGVRY